MKLKQKKCKKCPECNKLFLGWQPAKLKCCSVEIIESTAFTRLRIERIAFIYALSLTIVILLNIFALPKPEFGISVFFVLILPGLIFGIYFMMNEYLGDTTSINKKKEISLFKEIYSENNKPSEDQIAFSKERFLKEVLNFVGIFIVFIFLAIGITLMGKILK